ncbi:S1 family peptidase [Glaciecola sp. MF2-115]|uniref:S1 family peptidase n=1 Tax=Glaciecola sp. MF2-115 TaxID=3384827 RepID=UPI0039A1077A
MPIKIISFVFLSCLFFSNLTAVAIAKEDKQTTGSPSLVDSVKLVKPSVVGIALYTPMESKAPQLLGTGFVVGNGQYIVTNYHVVGKELDPSIVQNYVALSGSGPNPYIHKMKILAIDPVHDIAILSTTNKLPALNLAKDKLIDEGSRIFFTGFPIGAVLGLYPATHEGIVSAIAPDINPASNADQLTVQMLARLEKPFMIYQLDATAYPGNSGSPVFDRRTNEVIGVINKVFVSGGKEAALTNPSGISYAIPVRELRKLAKINDIEL